VKKHISPGNSATPIASIQHRYGVGFNHIHLHVLCLKRDLLIPLFPQ
jgi:hypothetical protein